MKIVFRSAPGVKIETEEDLRNHFDALLGAREHAVAQQAQKTAAVVSSLVGTLMADADQLSPTSRNAIADAARVLRGIEMDLSTLMRRRSERPTRALS